VRRSIRPTLQRHPRIFLGTAIFLVALLVRLIPLGRYVTPDEPIWVMRSIRFLDAMRARSWFQIPQTGHPGLPTMVLGALGVQITRWLDPVGAVEHLTWLRNLAWLAPENVEAIRRLAVFLPAARTLVAVTQSLGLVLVYGIGRNRVGERSARWIAVFLALDPFLIGHAGLLHTDALQATFVLLAVVFAMPPSSARSPGPMRELRGLDIKGGRWLSIILSGLCLALAGLTKLLGLLVAPGLAVALIAEGRLRGVQRWLGVGLLALSALGFGFALYPPFWVDPKAAADVLLNAMRYHEGLGLRNTFFAGRMTSDPGPWFYPVVILFRLTPPALVGLTLGSLRPRTRSFTEWGWFLFPATGYLGVLMVATKKFDRYALTPLVLLTALAALHRARDRVGRLGHQSLAAALLLPWAVIALLPLYYADPLLGGPWAARYLIPLGWGEGTGLATGKLAQEAGGDDVLLVENVPGAAPFSDGIVRPLGSVPTYCGDIVIEGLASGGGDRVRLDTMRIAGLPLATISASGGGELTASSAYLLPGPLPGFNEAASNVLVSPLTDTLHLHRWLSGQFANVQEFVWVRAPACYPLTDAHIASLVAGDSRSLDCTPLEDGSPFDFELCRLNTVMREPVPWMARFAQGLDLIAVSIPDSVRAPEALAVRMRWLPRVSPGDVELYLALRDPETGLTQSEGGRVAISERGWHSSAWNPHQTADTAAYIPIPRSLPPARYEITLRVSRIEGGWLGITQSDGDFGGTERALGEIEVLPPFDSADALNLPLELDVEVPGIRVLSAEVEQEEVWAGDHLPFRLEVVRTGEGVSPPLSWGLVCDGERRDRGGLRWSPGDLAAWPEGFRFELRYAPQLDPTLSDETCELRLMAGPSMGISLGSVIVRARARIFSLPGSPEMSLDVGAGYFGQLVGIDLSTDTLQVGDPVTVTLYWKASGSAEEDYTVFVHLADSEGIVWAQSDVQPAGGQAPTSSWIAGQVIVDRHRVSLPALAPTGAYTLWVGMYDPETGYRVPLDRDGERLPDDRVRVRDLLLR
jgi:hypothetical protein